jgi:DnaJ family protein A protein 2
MFEAMFGGMGGFPGAGGGFDPAGKRPKPRKGQNTNVEYSITLEDAYKGKKVVMALSRDRTCKGCNG